VRKKNKHFKRKYLQELTVSPDCVPGLQPETPQAGLSTHMHTNMHAHSFTHMSIYIYISLYSHVLSLPGSKNAFLLILQSTLFAVRVTEHWRRLPREALQSPCLEILKSHLDMVLRNQL